MPIFEYNGKKYNVRDEHIDSFMKDFPDASTIMEREGKKYRVKSADYRTFMSEQQQPEQSALDSTPETPVTPSAEEMPLTEQDKIRFSANIGQMKRRTEQMIDGFNERMETMREYHENAPLGGGQTAEGKMQFNPESGKLEKTYITPLGNRYTSKGLADMESFRYRQAADMSVNGQLRRAMLKLAELQEKREASAKRVHEQWEEDTKKNTAPLGFLLAADTYVPRQMSDKENSTLDVAIRQTEELIKDLEEQKDREQGIDVGFWRGFGRVAGDFRTWDFGMSDMRDALTMMNADDLKGENATEGEREAYNEMMGALYNKGQAEQMYGGNAGFWNRAGMMTGHMPAFMLDFGITGGGFKGINVLSKAGTKAATKVVGKETVEQMAKQGFKTYVKDNGVKGLGQYATNWTIKALGTTADDLLLRAPLMTNTVQAGKTTADIIDRKLGDVVVDENGNYDFSNDKTWGNAIWQGEANAIVENYSEMFGSHLDPVVTLGNMSKLANVVGAKRIGAVLSKTDAGALDGIMGQTHQLFNKMGVSDYFGEVTEEYYGQLWRTMLNLDDAYQQNPDGTRTNLLATGQFHGDIWGGMALSMGLMGAGKATLSGVQYASMKHGVNKADARATELLGKEIWEPLRATIDLTTNDDIGSVAEGIVNDKDFSDDERAAILTYMERSLMMRGFNLGTLAQKRGGEQDEDVQSMNESYIDGYNLADPQEMTDAKNMRDYQRQRVSAIVDENTLGFLDIHPMNALEEMRNNGLWGESELETVIDYLNAKQVYDGMIQRVRDDIDARVEQSNAMVDARTNRTSGMIQGATMKQDDRRVYVVGGNLVQYADGSGIDNRASDGSIIVRDAETGALEQVSPDAVLNIDEPLNPSDEKMTAEEAIIQQFAQEASDKIDGVVTFNPGDTYTITGDDAQIQVQIVANEDGIVDNGDGTVNVSDGVNIFPLAKETIQQQADAANLARVAQFEQQRTIENAERKQEMQEAERPQYALNDIVSLTDENGVTVRGNITADADADGKYEVFTEAPINGKRVNLFTRDELDNMLLEHNGVAFEHPAENESNNGAENIPENDNNAPQNIPAMQRIPKDEQGNPLYEQADSDTAWDAIVEQTEGDEDMAQTVADGMVADKEEALKKLEKAKSKGGNSIAEKIASEKERKAAIDAAKQDLLAWQKIAGTANRRRMAADAERKRMADEAAALRKAEEEKLRAEREEAERVEREALNGVPDMVDDTPQDARIISEINDLFAEQRKLEQSNSNEETTTPTDAAYTITPAQYTTKRGKVLDMHLVEFNNELRDTVRKHTTMFAKQLKGWWDKEKQGFMMRSKEDAERLAEYATDAQSQPPLSLSDLSEVNDGNVQFSEPQQQKATKQEERQEYTPIWQYSVFVDKETGETTLSRDDVSGSIPIGDARFRQTTNSPEEMLDILRNPQNGMQEVLDAVGISLENKIKTRELDRKAKDEIRDKRTDFVVDKEMDNRYSVRTLMKMIDAEKQAVMDLGEKRGGDVYHEGNIIFLTKDSADKFANEVRTLINDMRSEQQQDNSQKKTEASGNRLVTDERYAELRERMRKKLLGQMNIGIDPEILAIGTEMAVYHLEKGSRKFAEYATAMIADLGDAIRPYLKAFYNGARDLPEVAENGLDADMTPYDEVQQFDVANFDKKSIDALATAETVTRETEVEQEAEIAQERIKKSRPARKKNEKKAVNSRNQTGGLFGDLLTENDKADAELHRQFAMTVKADMLAALDNGTKPYRSILDLRKRASELGMEVDNDGRTDILLQELVEDGLVRAAREVIERKGSASRESYDLICKLYEMQPTISARSSNRIKMQQYSTPLPMAWIAGRFAMADKADGSVLEPTAGNGMLVFTIPVGQVHVNELDKTRLDNLREQGFAQVTQQDATEPFDGDVRYDVVIANPPFGKREAVEYDGKKIPGLDPQITLNALSSMKDDGRAAIIIGGNMEYANNGAIKSMKPFFTYLYDHYNVKGVIDMGGGLYAKQGTTFPTRMILIDGRRTNEERAQTAVYPPVENKAIRKAESFDDLYEIINEVLNFNEKTNGTEVLRSQGGRHLSVADNASGETDGAGHNRQSEADDESGSQTERRGRTGLEGNSESGQRPVLGKRGQNDTVGETGRGTDTIGKPSTDGRGLEQRTVGNEPQPVDGVDVQRIGLGLKGKPKKRDLTEEKLPYRPHNTAFRLESVAPAAMVEAMDKVLSQIEAQHGSIDEFVKTELGYDTIAETYQALAAEQMDSVAMAIYQMKQEQALIIGDQTGVGKGRQMAALIRWAVQRGEKPVFITQKADLFSDIYRDLVDVGSGDLVPFIFNSDGAMVDSKGNTVHKPLSSAEMAKVFASGALPEEYDFAVLTYSQVNTGDVVSQQEMEEAAKKSGARTKKSKNVKNGKATPKATFLRAIAKDNYLFLDESHTAAGSSNTGAYLQSILRGAKAATFASATFAKRPDTMPLYAIRTAMSQAKVDPDKMISIIEKGGVTLQEIMSRELTNAGQMVRRERDMSDVVTDWKTITDPETVRRARENYDRTIAAFNAIIKFQEDYVKPMIEALDMELAVMAESAGVKRGTDKMGVENVPFASKTYNYTKQLMLALKVNAIADEVEGEINAGRHPVIALESTMESSIKDYAAGEIIDEPTFSASLLKGLDTVMQYTVKDEDGNERHERYSPQALGPAGEKAYYELQDFIRESTSDIFISPLDAIIERLNKKGYKVGELTGRNMYVERNDDGRVVVKRRTDKDKKKMQREFNSGVLDVLILNKSASTGISLHASEKFSDQRQRSMIIAQPLSDINDYMQMIGRIDRTGQVHRGYYINLGLPVPAENRFLMMLSTKLKSLNANTTTSQDSESNDVEAPDLLNKYGSQVVVEYLRDNVDIYEKMGTPLKKGGLGGGRVQASELEDYKPQEDDARKITGYVALLATKEQEEFYDDVVRRYNELIKYLNDTGSNDLKITVMPLRATTIEKRISSEGIDPDGNNPFARNSFVEKVEMDVLRKPMKADEIRKVIEQINKGVEPNTYLDNVIETIRKEDEVRIAAEDERYEKSKAKAIDDIAKQTEKINGQKKRSDEEKRVAIDNFIAETNEKVEAKHKDNILRLNTNSDQMMRRLRMFEVGKSYLVPDNLESMIFDFATSAIFCGYKTKDSKITASTTLAVFATLDGRRRIEIKLSQIDALRSIDKVTNDNWDAARATTLDNWDSQIPSETRKTGFIMTGNILQAIADTQDEYGGYPGQLISYTDIDGNVHDGILMPDKWNASMLKTSGAPLSSRLQQIKDYTPITSHDGKVEIMGNSWAKMFYLTVPKTKKDGAVYYENKTLLRAAGGNFYPYRGKLRADIPEERIIEVVKELAKLGVKVKDDTTDILQRNGIGAYNDDEVSYENDPVAKLLGQSRRTAKQRREFARRERQRMAERVESLAEKLHLDNVEVVTDASVLDGKKQRAKGFYSKSTGKITIVIPNHTSTFDVEQTLLHEAVAHYGLRQLFGEHFDTFLDNVFNNADENIRRRIVDMAAKNGWDFHKATEEYLASLAEDTEFENINASWWQQIKDFFLNMLHKIGFEDFRGVTLSDNELRYILWRSYENLAEPGRYRNILGEAADVAKQYELKVGNYAVSDPHHQTVAESDDALYRTGDPEIHERELARDRYERRVKSGMFQSQEALQDSMLGLKEAMTAILGKETNIEDVDGFENAYLGENRLSSVNKAEADAFAHTLFKPMLDEVAKLARTEAEREELTDYMMAKHGLERNTYMRNEAINNGATDADQTDYAGLTALTGMDNVADAETEAQIMVNDYEQAHDTTDLWKKVNAASKAILSKSYECGMMSKATFDKISDMYDFYIPLRGFDEKTSSEAYAYLTHKQSAFNAPIKKAEGRRSKADDPFANLQSMAEGAIMQGNRNKLVKQRFLNFALNHPSDLVSVSDIWVEYDTVADEWKPVFPDNIDSTDTPEVVERKMLDFETKMESLAQQYPDRYKHGKDTVNIPYRIVESRDMRQHQIVVKRGGRDYVITINGNPRAAQALNGQTNPDNDMSGAIGAILRAGENINRQLSAFYTTRNPDFIVSNFMRDMLYTNTMTWIRESPNYALRFHRNYMYANPVRIKQLLAKHRKGTLDMSNKTEAMFHQFMMNGGETGYANIRDIEQHKNDIRRELKKSNGKIPVKKAWDLLGGRFDEYNRAVENCARFAAFMTSREMGRSIDRAIYDAKEISVNFNKKGSGAKFYDSTGQTKAGNASALVSGLGRSGYVFWNAAIQGTANFGRQMKRHPAKAFTGIAAMFLLGAIVAYLGGDDDDDDDKNAYYNLPEYVRRSNILFRAGNSWVSIPLPVEYRAVYGMGELMISVLNGKEHLTDGEIAEAITGQATQILPIDFLEGGGGLNAFVPSAYKPLWEAYVAEKSWTGMPLYKDTPYNKDMPEWTKAYKSANKYIVGLANAMNEATGGDPYTKGTIDFNPAKIEYMLNGYFGGVFGTIDKLSKMVETVTGNREYDPRSFLLANRLVKAGDERTEYRAVNNEYFRLKEEHDRLKSRLKHYEEDTDNDIFDYAEKIDFLYNSPEYERYEIFEDYREDIDDLYNELKEAISDEERKDIEAELNELKKEMIEEMNKTRK